MDGIPGTLTGLRIRLLIITGMFSNHDYSPYAFQEAELTTTTDKKEEAVKPKVRRHQYRAYDSGKQNDCNCHISGLHKSGPGYFMTELIVCFLDKTASFAVTQAHQPGRGPLRITFHRLTHLHWLLLALITSCHLHTSHRRFLHTPGRLVLYTALRPGFSHLAPACIFLLVGHNVCLVQSFLISNDHYSLGISVHQYFMTC